MNLGRALAVTQKTLRALKHDRRTAGFLVLMPLLMITLFGYTFGGELKDVSICIVDLDQGSPNGSASADIASALSASDVVTVTRTFGPGDGQGDPIAAAVDTVRRTDAWAAVVFGEDFTRNVLASIEALRAGTPSAPVPVTVYIDATNPNIAQAVLAEVQKAVTGVLVTEYGLAPTVSVVEDRVYGEGAEFIDFFAPGVMGLAAMMVTFMISIISFVHERSSHTLERALTTPVTEGEFVAGYAIAFGFVALIQSAVILVAAMLLFQIQIEGSALLALAIIFVLGVGTQGLGFLLSSNAKSEFQAIQFLPLILFPSILLAGVFWPLESVPTLLRPISDFIPLTYAVDACRSVMIRGWGLADVWPQLTVLIAFAAATLTLSAYSLKRRG